MQIENILNILAADKTLNVICTQLILGTINQTQLLKNIESDLSKGACTMLFCCGHSILKLAVITDKNVILVLKESHSDVLYILVLDKTVTVTGIPDLILKNTYCPHSKNLFVISYR